MNMCSLEELVLLGLNVLNKKDLSLEAVCKVVHNKSCYRNYD